MDHVVYLDYKAKELDNLINGSKSMIIRGAAGRKMPYGRVFEGDTLYFIENKGDGLIKAKATVKHLFQSEKLEKGDSQKLIERHQDKLLLNTALIKRFGGKRYIILLDVDNIESLEPFRIDRSNYGNMDDWLAVEDIKKVRI